MGRILLATREIEAASEKYGTPLYLYNFNKIDRQYALLEKHLPSNFRIHYALKANSNLSICHRLARLGCGADVSSLGELRAALKTGFSPELILFTGPGKTTPELTAALEAGIGLIVVESVNEARRLNDLARQCGIRQKVLIRINPLYRTSQSCEISQAASKDGSKYGSNLGNCSEPSAPVQTIATNASKFGVDEAQAEEAIATIGSLSNLELQGIHIFTETNVIEYQQLLASWQNTIAIANGLAERGYPISHIDFGGGIGIPYNWVDDEFDAAAFGKELERIFAGNPYQYNCIVEIGRYLVGEAGCYLTEVTDIKESQGQKFVIVDGGVHNLFRLSMKVASRYMQVLGKQATPAEKAIVGGKLPTPLDIMVEGVAVPSDLAIGDKIVIYNCGAYGFNHSLTNFTLQTYPAEVAYSNGEMQLIRKRGNVEDLLANQKLPLVEDPSTKILTRI